ALVHAEAAGNIAVEGRVQTPGFESQVARAYRLIKVEIRSHRQNALPLEPRAAHAAWDTATARVTLTCATQLPHATRTIIADIVADVGAYSCYPTTCAVEPLMAMAELPGPYDVREYSCIARGVLTNTCPMAPYRGVSRPVITFAVERLMDKAAAAFGLDPIEM